MKKRMNRIISLLLVVTTLISISSVNLAFAADTDAEIRVESMNVTASMTTSTDIFVPVKISNNVGFAALDTFFTLPDGWTISNIIYTTRSGEQTIFQTYDVDSEGYKLLDGLTVNATPTTKSFIVVYATTDKADITENGTMCWLKVSIPAAVVDGDYSIAITAKEIVKANDSTVDIKDQFTCTPGTIKVTGGIPVEGVTPSITTQPTGATYTYAPTAPTVTPLTVAASVTQTEGSTLTYQWYSKATEGNAEDTKIEGATEVSYTPSLSAFGTAGYYCVVTNTYNGQKYTATSDVAAVTYNKAALTDDMVRLSATELKYTGGEIGPTVTVTGPVSSDYSVSGNKGTEVGENYSVTVSAAENGNYTGSVNKPWKIVNADLTDVTENQTMTVYNNGKTFALPAITATAVGGKTVNVSYAVTSGGDLITLDSTNKTVTGNASKATGTAVITATISADSHNTVTRTITVTVQNKTDVSNYITLSKKNDAPTTYTEGFNKKLSDFVDAATFTGIASGTSSITYTLNGAVATMDTAITNAGEYTVVATYEDDTQYGTKTVEFTIARATVAVPTAVDNLVYNTNSQTGVVLPAGAKYTLENNTKTDAGDYQATATLTNTTNYMWADETDTAKTIPWSIAKRPIDVSAWTWSTQTSFTYNGSEHSVTLLNTNTDFDKVDVQYTDNAATNVGDSSSHTANATVTVKSDCARNYKLEGTVPTCSWTLNPAEINVSGVSFTAPDLTYNKSAQTVSLSNVPAHVNVSVKEGTDAATQTAANSYNTTFVLAPESTNYTLTGRDSYEIAAAWTIKKATVAVPAAITGLVFDGTEKTGVADPAADAPYTVSGNKQTNAGTDYTATAVLKDKDNYEWIVDGGNTSDDRTIKWSIAKAAALTNLTNDQAKMRYDDTDGLTIDGDTFITGGNASFETSNITVTGDAASALTVTAVSNDVKINLKSSDKDNAGKTATIVVNFTTPNYEGTNKMMITLNITSKTSVGDKITFAGGEVTYNGQHQQPTDATINITPSGTPTWTYVFKDSDGNEVTEMKNAGVYTVTATYEDDDNYGTTDPANFTIKQAEVTITGGTVVAKTYDGTTTAEVTAPTVRGTVSGETLTPGTDFNISNASFENADAGSNKTVSYSVALADTDLAKNYTLTASTGSAKGTITPKSVAVTVDSIDAQTYTGIALKPAVTVTATGTINGYELIKDTDYTVSYSGNTSVGTATATVSTKTGSNYTFTAVNENFTIDPAPLTISGVVIANKVYDATDAAAATAVVFTGLVNSETLTLGVDYTVTAAFADANAGEGKPVSYTVTLTDTAKANNYTLTGGVPGTTTADITKATPTGEPVYTKITSAGKTLADAKLEIGTLTPADGTLTWIDEDGNVMSSDTKVKANRAYTWKYTPDDTTNYNTISGEIVLYVYRAVVPPAIGNAINVARVENGTVKLSTDNARPGRVVTITVSPADGYELESLLIYDTKDNLIQVTDHGDGTYSFVMPNCDVTVKVSFAKVTSDSAISFVDVPADSWYADAVAMMVNKGLFNGTSATTFSPNGNMTRAMLWTVLARMEGVDTTGGANWYEKGMNWAITEGISDGTNPGGNITREQLITMLWRYVGSPSASENSLRVFADVDDISSWATTAMAWATENGILNGINGNALPASNATRAQVAVILMRFVEKFAM